MTYRPAPTMTTVLATLLGLCALLALLAAVADLMQLSLLGRAAQGIVTETEADSNDQRVMIIALLRGLVFLATAVTFGMWTYRMSSNAHALTTGLDVSPGWAVGYYFIPFLNLYRPYQAIKEVWQACEADPQLRDGTRWKVAEVPALLPLWWGAWLLSGFAGRLLNRASGDPDTLEELTTVTQFSIALDLWFLLTSLLALAVVVKLHQRQEHCARVVGTIGLEPTGTVLPVR